jgi:hypothetical protein
MAAASYIVREIRFVIGEELTEVFIAVDALGDCPDHVQGWHYKAYPKEVAAIEILENIRNGGTDSEFLLWPLKAPIRIL